VVKVFISYSSADSKFADQLTSLLQNEDIDVWSAEKEIVPGELFVEKLDSAIMSADAIISVLSKSSGSAQYQQFELASALANGKKIIPIVIDREANVPFSLRNLQYLNIDNQNDLSAKIPLLKRSIESVSEFPTVETIAESDVIRNKLGVMRAMIDNSETLLDALEYDRSLLLRVGLVALVLLVSISLILLILLPDSPLAIGVIIGFVVGFTIQFVIVGVAYISRKRPSAISNLSEVQGE
jgi:hypothetical protein